MSRPSMLRSVALGTILATGLLLGSASTGVTQTAESYSAYIVAGTCDELATTSVAELNPVSVRGSGTPQGVTDVQTVLYSDTDDDDLNLGIQTVLAAPHSIVITTDLADTAAAVACGEIGGVVIDDDLVIALAPLNDSGYTGIALLDGDDDDDELEVDIYLSSPKA